MCLWGNSEYTGLKGNKQETGPCLASTYHSACPGRVQALWKPITPSPSLSHSIMMIHSPPRRSRWPLRKMSLTRPAGLTVSVRLFLAQNSQMHIAVLSICTHLSLSARSTHRLSPLFQRFFFLSFPAVPLSLLLGNFTPNPTLTPPPPPTT